MASKDRLLGIDGSVLGFDLFIFLFPHVTEVLDVMLSLGSWWVPREDLCQVLLPGRSRLIILLHQKRMTKVVSKNIGSFKVKIVKLLDRYENLSAERMKGKLLMKTESLLMNTDKLMMNIEGFLMN